MSPSPAPPRPRKRTTVRLSRAVLPFVLPVVGRLAPGPTERWALRTFGTTRGPRTAAPPPDASHVFTLAAGEQRLRVWEWGPGSATVVLAHGWNGHAGQMAAFVAPLRELGLHVVAFDQPAHGRSDGTYATVADLRDAVAAVADRLAPVQAIIAHSLGATGTVLALARGLRVPRAVLLAPPDEMAPYLQQLGSMLRLPDARVAGMIARAQRAAGGVLSASEAIHRAAAPRPPTRVLVLHDPDDREVAFAEGRRLAAALAGARLVSFAGIGHHGLLTDPAAVRTAAAFAAGVEDPRRRGTTPESDLRAGVSALPARG
jgi:pimeloyl-ACP methyl ester carboxylesterase